MTDGFYLLPSLPEWLAIWGTALLAVLSAAGCETALFLAGFLVSAGILQGPEAAAAAFVPAVAAESALFALRPARDSALFRFFTQNPMIGPGAPEFSGTAREIFFHRFMPQKKSRVPALAGEMRIPFPRYAACAVPGAALWCLVTGGLGFAAGLFIEEAVSGRAAVWVRLPGFLLLLALAYPLCRFVLWYKISRMSAKRRNSRKEAET